MKYRKLFVRSTVLCLCLLLVAVTVALGATTQRDFTEAQSPESGQTDYVVVTFNDPPAASYTGGKAGLPATKPARGEKMDPADPEVAKYRDHLQGVHADFEAYLANKAPRAEVVREFFYTANGLAIHLNGTDPRILADGPDVRNVSRSTLYKPTMNVSTGLIKADVLWPAAGGRGNAGAGIKVGIIDSGIDETHSFFACKDQISHKVYASGEAFDPDNTLVMDHGTHVAGTVAGCVTELTEGPITGTMSGVAPGAELWDYNVFPGYGAGYVAFGGSAFSHDIIAALEDTVRDGMDVVNMSLGGGVDGPHDTLAEAVNATVDAGIVVAVAAGNSGPGDATLGSPGNAAKALTAGASTNPHFIGISVTVGEDSFGAALGDFDSFGVVTEPYAVTEPANGCSAITTDLTGKIALIDRGACTFTTKIRNAQEANAIGVLVVNNVAGDPVAMAHDGTDPFPTIPAAMVGKAEGNAMKPGGEVSIDGTTSTHILSDNVDIIAGFSSRGPTPFTYQIKPDLTAPGVNVYSSVFNDGYAMFQGTSMATPHLAGSSALLLQLRDDWSPADVKSALVNTASRTVTDHVNAAEDPGVLARGGGRADLEAAYNTPLTINPASASFGLWTGNETVQASLDLAVRNVSNGDKTCSADVTGPSIVTVSPSTFTLGSGESGALTLQLDGGRSDTTGSGDYSGDVVIVCGDTTLQVPWWTRVDREGRS